MLLLLRSRVGKGVPGLFLAWLDAVVLDECLDALKPLVQLVPLRQD